MQKKFFVLVVMAVAVTLLAACGGGNGGEVTSGGGTVSGGATAGSGNAANGETLFKQTMIGSLPGCVTCHSLDGSKLVGPSMQGIASRAGNTVSGQTAEQYLRTSITEPNAHVVEGFTQGVMQPNKDLSGQRLNDLIAYLLTLK